MCVLTYLIHNKQNKQKYCFTRKPLRYDVFNLVNSKPECSEIIMFGRCHRYHDPRMSIGPACDILLTWLYHKDTLLVIQSYTLLPVGGAHFMSGQT